MGTAVWGEWGSFDVGYALKIELGTGPEGPVAPHVRKYRRGPAVRSQGQGVLRQQADEYYPGLTDRIRKRYGAR